jgi:hypothetical protein
METGVERKWHIHLTCIAQNVSSSPYQQWVAGAREAGEWRARTSYARLHVVRGEVEHTFIRMWFMSSHHVV